MKNLTFLVAVFLFTVVCAKDGRAETSIKVFKSRGSLQCKPQSGTSLETMQDELAKAGIPVTSFACGNNGMIQTTVCGASDGVIYIFEIPRSKAAQASALRFVNLDSLPDSTEIPCK